MSENVEEMLFLSQIFANVKPVNLLKQMFTDSISPIVITDAGHLNGGYKIVYANKAFCRINGYSLAELVGSSPKIFQGPNSNQAVLEKLGEELQSKGHFRGISQNYRKDGSCYPLSWDISSVRDDTGKIILFVSVQRDLTDLMEKSKNIKDVNEKIRHFIHEVSSGEVEAEQVKCKGKDLIKDLKDNAKLYTAPLKDESIETVEDLFFDIDASGAESDSNGVAVKTAMSAEEYLQKERLTQGELESLIETLRDVEEEMECLVADATETFHLDIIETKLRQLSDDLFFLVEFTDAALAIADVADNISFATPQQLADFLLDTLKTMIEEVDNWLSSVFVTKTATNIYDGASMTIASAKQVKLMLQINSDHR